MNNLKNKNLDIFFQIDEKEVDLIKVNLRQEEEEKYHGGSRMSISSRRSSVSSVGSRLLAGGRMGRAKDQTQKTASEQHASKLVANTSYLVHTRARHK